MSKKKSEFNHAVDQIMERFSNPENKRNQMELQQQYKKEREKQKEGKKMKEEKTQKKVEGLINTVVILLFLIITILNSYTIIPTGYTGVRTTFKQVDNVVLQNGLNFKIPYVQKIAMVNNKLQDIVFSNWIWSETSERTALYYSDVTVSYQINPEKSAWIYANVSSYKDNLITESIVASAIKSSSKTLNSTEATNRSLIEPLTQETLQASLDSKYGENTVIIHKVVIGNTDFEDSYNQAIADKQNQQIAYEQQQIENQKAIEKAEADAKVAKINAEAEKQKTEIAAEAKANAIKIEAEAQAEANKMINDSVTANVIAYMQTDKWDGAKPKVMLGDDSQVIVDAGNMTK